ncbi:MAG: hypothetical protein MUC39_05875 [Candidatus Omnitrophica bacterium]|jgi:hypothetical protein|nr:hypothetical protein [Candidatus Omnitrophota bacterium]
MKRKLLIFAAVLGVLFFIPCFAAYAQSAGAASKEISKEQAVVIATEVVKGQGFQLEDANIIYDEGGKLWSERIGYLSGEDKSPNHGILRQGFLKNYRTVYFDYKEPVPDIWVFIDKDSGEVLTVYREEAAQ